jgi:fumarate hydratase, class I
MLNPSDNLVDWVLKTVPTMGAGWCPPGMLGIGIGGTPEKAMLLAKEVLMEPIDIHELQGARPVQHRSKNCASSCTTRSTRWASAPRAWAG